MNNGSNSCVHTYFKKYNNCYIFTMLEVFYRNTYHYRIQTASFYSYCSHYSPRGCKTNDSSIFVVDASKVSISAESISALGKVHTLRMNCCDQFSGDDLKNLTNVPELYLPHHLYTHITRYVEGDYTYFEVKFCERHHV
jgi:hypothetical protein